MALDREIETLVIEEHQALTPQFDATLHHQGCDEIVHGLCLALVGTVGVTIRVHEVLQSLGCCLYTLGVSDGLEIIEIHLLYTHQRQRSNLTGLQVVLGDTATTCTELHVGILRKLGPLLTRHLGLVARRHTVLASRIDLLSGISRIYPTLAAPVFHGNLVVECLADAAV